MNESPRAKIVGSKNTSLLELKNLIPAALFAGVISAVGGATASACLLDASAYSGAGSGGVSTTSSHGNGGVGGKTDTTGPGGSEIDAGKDSNDMDGDLDALDDGNIDAADSSDANPCDQVVFDTMAHYQFVHFGATCGTEALIQSSEPLSDQDAGIDAQVAEPMFIDGEKKTSCLAPNNTIGVYVFDPANNDSLSFSIPISFTIDGVKKLNVAGESPKVYSNNDPVNPDGLLFLTCEFPPDSFTQIDALSDDINPGSGFTFEGNTSATNSTLFVMQINK